MTGPREDWEHLPPAWFEQISPPEDATAPLPADAFVSGDIELTLTQVRAIWTQAAADERERAARTRSTADRRKSLRSQNTAQWRADR